jgi:hypothetical protein
MHIHNVSRAALSKFKILQDLLYLYMKAGLKLINKNWFTLFLFIGAES